MKRLAILALSAAALAPALAQTSVGVSIGINQPGVYGRITLGDYPQPRFINAQPVVISQPRYYVQQQPVYLYVPPGHQKNWGRYCGRYGACGQQVYFVREDWIRDRWNDHRRHDHDRRSWDRRDDHRGPPGHGPDRGHGRDRHDNDRGPGRGRD